MIRVVNQLRRIWTDNGTSDRDYHDQECRLHEAQKSLYEAADEVTKASELLRDLLKIKGLIH